MEKTKSKAAYTAQELAKCAIFVVLMTVAAYIKIPFWPVPLSFQTVVCVLTGLLLGWKYGGLAMLCYLLLGVVGVPVFTKGGGFWYVMELTFGYIIGFVAAAFVAGLIAHRRERVGFKRMIVAALAAMLANYLIGVVYFCCIWHFYMKASGLWTALWSYNILYMFKDIVLCVLAAILAQKVLPLINRKFRKSDDNVEEESDS